MKLIEDLISKGFEPFRKIGSEYKKYTNNGYFSSCVGGMIDIRLLRGDKEIVIGLYEKDYPPTLIHPNLGSTNTEIEQRLIELTVDDIINLS